MRVFHTSSTGKHVTQTFLIERAVCNAFLRRVSCACSRDKTSEGDAKRRNSFFKPLHLSKQRWFTLLEKRALLVRCCNCTAGEAKSEAEEKAGYRNNGSLSKCKYDMKRERVYIRNKEEDRGGDKDEGIERTLKKKNLKKST